MVGLIPRRKEVYLRLAFVNDALDGIEGSLSMVSASAPKELASKTDLCKSLVKSIDIPYLLCVAHGYLVRVYPDERSILVMQVNGQQVCLSTSDLQKEPKSRPCCQRRPGNRGKPWFELVVEETQDDGY